MNNKINLILLAFCFILVSCGNNETHNTAANEEISESVINIEDIEEESEKNIVSKTADIPQNDAYAETEYYFSYPTLKGKTIDLKDYKNQPVVLMYFSSRCPYCVMAAETMENLKKKYTNHSVLIVTATSINDADGARDFAEETKLSVPVVLDEGTIAYSYGVRGVPHFFLLDKKHNVYKNWAGFGPGLEEIISKELDGLL